MGRTPVLQQTGDVPAPGGALGATPALLVVRRGRTRPLLMQGLVRQWLESDPTAVTGTVLVTPEDSGTRPCGAATRVRAEGADS